MLEKLDTFQYIVHLNGPGMSGRGVKFRQLPPQEKRKSDSLAAGMTDKDATVYDFHQTRLSEGVKTFITEITVKAHLASLDAVDGKPVQWQKVSYVDLKVGGDYDIDKGDVFTAADIEALEGLYKMYHEPTAEAVKSMLEKAKPAA